MFKRTLSELFCCAQLKDQPFACLGTVRKLSVLPVFSMSHPHAYTSNRAIKIRTAGWYRVSFRFTVEVKRNDRVSVGIQSKNLALASVFGSSSSIVEQNLKLDRGDVLSFVAENKSGHQACVWGEIELTRLRGETGSLA